MTLLVYVILNFIKKKYCRKSAVKSCDLYSKSSNGKISLKTIKIQSLWPIIIQFCFRFVCHMKQYRTSKVIKTTRLSSLDIWQRPVIIMVTVFLDQKTALTNEPTSVLCSSSGRTAQLVTTVRYVYVFHPSKLCLYAHILFNYS